MIELFGAYIILYALLYFIPWFVALGRGHNNTTSIFILTLFLGWSFVGWVVALVWSFTNNVHTEEGQGPGNSQPKIASDDDYFEWKW